MEVKEMLEIYKAPNVYLEDIVTRDIKQTRLLGVLIDDGIKTIDDLKKLSDEELLQLPMIWVKKLDKIREFVTDWYEDDFPNRNKVNVSDVSTIVRGLQEDVFLTNKNIEMISMRGKYKTYEEIGEYFGQSRQSVQFTETATQKKFIQWYEANRLYDKIGDLNDFMLYCDKKIPEDQRQLKTAVRRLIILTVRKNEKQP